MQVLRHADRRAERHPAFLTGGGEMGRLLRTIDWSGTSLGPPEQWPQSLRSAVSILLPSRAQICLFWGPDLCAIYNDAYRPTLGMKHPRALGQPAREVWREFWDDVLRPLLEGVVQTGEAFWGSDYPFFLQRHGFPEETYFDVSYDPVRDESGKVGGVFCIVSETTGRVLGERRLGILRDIGRLASEAHDADDAFQRVANVLCDRPRDLPFALFYAPGGDGAMGCVAACGIEPMDAAAWPLARVAAERQEVFLTGEELAAYGNFPGAPWPEPARAVGILPIAVAGEAPLGFLVAGVSPRRPLDDGYRDFLRLVASNMAAVVSTARALEEERKRAETLAELDRAKTIFFSNISHEFRTPLTLMLGPLEDVLNDASAAGLTDRQRERLEIAQRNSLRLLKLVNTLLDFSRIEAGRVRASYVPTDLAGLTADLASGFRSAIERAGLSLQVECTPLPQQVHVDHDMWEKVVLNLLSNALKFTFAGGINVALHAEGGRAVLTVRDTGVGIPSSELPRLFERFHRINGQRSRSFEGSGIGLALVHELVRLLGGTIAAASQEGVGTTFTVTVPFGTAHLPAEQIGASPAQVSTATRVEAFVEEALRWLPDEAPAAEPDLLTELTAVAGGDHPLVLLADDNADMRDYVRRLLAPRYRVVAVPDGKAALNVMQRTKPDLLLADVMMPGLDGFGLLHAIRAEPELREIPVILLSARAGEEARVDGLEAGADDYLIKPFSARELLARIGGNLSLAKGRREATQAALDSADRLREMFAQAPGFMCMLRGPNHVFELANDAYLRVVGQRPLIGLPVRQAFPELADQGYFELLDGVYRSGKPYAGTAHRLLLRRQPDGPLSERFMDFVYQPIRDSAGAVSGVFVEGVDVTERVLAERALREMNERLEQRVTQRTAELTDALGQLRAEIAERETAQEALRQAQKIEALGQLTGGVAHDFNNLLTAILGGAETLRRNLPQQLGAGEGRVTRALAMIEQGAQRAATLTQRLLAFGRRQALAPRPVDINRLVDGMIELLRRTLGESVLVQTIGSGGLWPVLADPNQLESALLNLAVNARDAMPRGGRLIIETANRRLDTGDAARLQDLTPGDYTMVAVRDTGSGMDETTLARAFEPFFTTKKFGQGTGLGLSQVYGFIRQSQGQIEIESEPGRGTVVRLYLPRFLGAVSDAPIAAPGTEALPLGSSELVLVVEDDEAVRAHSAETLRELGYRVLEAPDAAVALELSAGGAAIRLMFTDIGLPGGMNGRDLAERVWQTRPELPVLFTTGYAGNALVRGRLPSERTALLPKPFTRGALATAMRRLLDR